MLEILDTISSISIYQHRIFICQVLANSAILACHMKILENLHYLCQDILGIPEKNPSQSIKFLYYFNRSVA